MREKSDTTLAGETRARDRDTFCELVRRHGDFACRPAMGLIADSELADSQRRPRATAVPGRVAQLERAAAQAEGSGFESRSVRGCFAPEPSE